MNEPKPAPQAPQPIGLIYFNSFRLSVSSADVGFGLQVDGFDSLEVKCSFTTAKTLSGALVELIKQLEESTGHNFMTQNQVAASMAEYAKRKSSGSEQS
jgi:hypothetical protein